MTVTQVPLRPLARGSLVKLVLAIALLVVAAFFLARLGTGPLRGETTASGIEFRTLKAGTGPLIQREDAALVDYVGTFDDGKTFDASQQPVPMIPMAVIPGFAEAMMKMQKIDISLLLVLNTILKFVSHNMRPKGKSILFYYNKTIIPENFKFLKNCMVVKRKSKELFRYWVGELRIILF